MYAKGYAADETKAAFERAGDVAMRADLTAERFPALYGQFYWSLMRGDARAARDLAERFLREAEAEGRISEICVGHRLLGLAYLFLGELAGAQTQLEQAIAEYDGERDGGVREKFGQDSGVTARCYLAHASWFAGDPRRARQLSQEAIGLGRELDHLPSIIVALLYKMGLESARNDPEVVVGDAENLLTISQQHGIKFYVALCRVYLSWAQGRLGDARARRRGTSQFDRRLQEPRQSTQCALFSGPSCRA